MPIIVIADKPGQLGNMLFLTAHFIGRAIESNFTIANPAFENYAKYFPSVRDDVFCRFPRQKSRLNPNGRLRLWVYKLSNFMVKVLKRLGGGVGPVRSITLTDWTTTLDLGSEEFLKTTRDSSLLFVRGWRFRDQRMLEKHADAIREYFTPLQQHLDNVDELIKGARVDTDVLVGVHIRHGIIDFDNARHYRHDPETFAEMMGRVKALFPGKRVTFVICSDKEQDPAVFSDYRFYFGTGQLIEDMYVFAKCDYIFGSPSTFTLWASFYGNVPVCLVSKGDHEFKLDHFQAMPAC